MILEQRIAQIIAMECLTPEERAAMICAHPAVRYGASYALASQNLAIGMKEILKTMREKQQLPKGGHHGRAPA